MDGREALICFLVNLEASKADVKTPTSVREFTSSLVHKVTYATLIPQDWLASHRNLFIATCRGCAKHLYFDSPQFKYLPPTVRSWRGMRRGQGGPRRTGGGGSTADLGATKVGGERLMEGGGMVEEEVGVPFHPQCL